MFTPAIHHDEVVVVVVAVLNRGLGAWGKEGKGKDN
jgi:hypothetical protein